MSGLIADAQGDLYGTTYSGGANGDGMIYELAAGSYTLTILASFDGTNGANPMGNLLADAAGNLYGTTYLGGDSPAYGTVFEFIPSFGARPRRFSSSNLLIPSPASPFLHPLPWRSKIPTATWLPLTIPPSP